MWTAGAQAPAVGSRCVCMSGYPTGPCFGPVHAHPPVPGVRLLPGAAFSECVAERNPCRSASGSLPGRTSARICPARTRPNLPGPDLAPPRPVSCRPNPAEPIPTESARTCPAPTRHCLSLCPAVRIRPNLFRLNRSELARPRPGTAPACVLLSESVRTPPARILRISGFACRLRSPEKYAETGIRPSGQPRPTTASNSPTVTGIFRSPIIRFPSAVISRSSSMRMPPKSRYPSSRS